MGKLRFLSRCTTMSVSTCVPSLHPHPRYTFLSWQVGFWFSHDHHLSCFLLVDFNFFKKCPLAHTSSSKDDVYSMSWFHFSSEGRCMPGKTTDVQQMSFTKKQLYKHGCRPQLYQKPVCKTTKGAQRSSLFKKAVQYFLLIQFPKVITSLQLRNSSYRFYLLEDRTSTYCNIN